MTARENMTPEQKLWAALEPHLEQMTDAEITWAIDRTAAMLCPHCAAGVAHHSNGEGAISDEQRMIRYDLHAVPCEGGVTLDECLAARLFDPKLL